MRLGFRAGRAAALAFALGLVGVMLQKLELNRFDFRRLSVQCREVQLELQRSLFGCFAHAAIASRWRFVLR
jgi:hypothetical protein